MIKSIEGYSYKINEHIGKGYSSTVHKGKRDCTGEEVSIKVIEMSKLEDPINHMLLQYEVAALKSLTTSHNVLHLYDVYSTKNNTYIITELMEGDLHTLLKQKKQFPYYEACEIIKQIITGYYDVFRSGYLHRDIKPANIFYRQGSYKIGDFGFAIPAKDYLEHRQYNVGSPVYMPPQALKDNIYTCSCDTWAIGVIFYQLLKGLVPWRAISEQKLYEKIMTEPLYQLTFGLPQVVRTFLSKLLSLDSSQRMTPQELVTWPNKLFSVQIRSMTPMTPSQNRPVFIKAPLQEIPLPNQNLTADNMNSTYSRSKSYSSNQVPSYVSGLRINLPSSQQNTSQMSQKLGQNIFMAPSTPTVISNALSQMSMQPSFQSIKPPLYLTQHISQKSSAIFMPECKKQIAEFIRSSLTTPEIYASNITSYIKFIYRVVKFVSQPTEVPLKDLEMSLVRTLFKEIQRAKTFGEAQNLDIVSVSGWKEFINSSEGQQKFVKKLHKINQKVKMFHPLPANEFILEVYKEQLTDGIIKIHDYLSKTQYFSKKAVVSLELLINFFEVWNSRQTHIQNRDFDLAEFLSKWEFQKLIDQDIYSGDGPNMNDLKNKMRSFGLIQKPERQEKQEGAGTKARFDKMVLAHQELIKMR